MKIVFIIDQIYKHGGIERVLSVKANYLAQHTSHHISIVTHEQDSMPLCYEFHESISFNDLGINYNRNKSYFHPINILKIPKHIFKISSYLKRINADIIVVCSHTTDTYFLPFICKKIPKIKEFHYSKFIEIKERDQPKSIMKKYFLKFADYVEGKYDRLVVLNKDEASYYKTNNITIIPNPLTFFPKNISETTNNVVITAGRIAPVKGYDLLIEIWSLISNNYPDWQLHIYGEGNKSYEQMLNNMIITMGLSDTIHLKGTTNIIKEKMLESSIFVMSSHNECFPLVLLEAKACGLPIVAFDCPHGPANIIKYEDGRLIPLYDKKEFSKQVMELMARPDMRKQMGENARQDAIQYKTEFIIKKWLALFNELTLK